MNFNNLKRKAFFWVEKLQISRTERISITLLLVLLVVLFSSNYFLAETFNFNQERYDEITAEFERRSAIIQQQEKELETKYNPDLTVSEANEPDAETIYNQAESNETETPEIININLASSAQLQALTGIGATYAERIIEYRELNGGFDSIDELVNVKGIGKTRLENIRPFITIE
ncbi:MAG: helix-hairpin-helix domain-containing protein [Balneolaceae bacterium]